jgi:hypothetical protein
MCWPGAWGTAGLAGHDEYLGREIEKCRGIGMLHMISSERVEAI